MHKSNVPSMPNFWVGAICRPADRVMSFRIAGFKLGYGGCTFAIKPVFDSGECIARSLEKRGLIWTYYGCRCRVFGGWMAYTECA